MDNSVRAIVAQFRLLSMDADNQPYIARESGCLAGLLGFLSHQDQDVQEMAADTLSNLSQHPDNLQVLTDDKNLIGKLLALSEDPSRPALQALSTLVLRNLHVIADFPPSELPAPALPLETPPRLVTPLTPRADCVPTGKAIPATVELQVEGMEYVNDQEKVETVLINLIGVISVACDLAREQVIIRTNGTPAETLISALKDAGYVSALISQQIDGKGPTALDPSLLHSLPPRSPQYLPVNAGEHRVTSGPNPDRKALAPRDINSLEARLEEQRRKELKKKHRQDTTRKSLFGFVRSAIGF
mmetsp:Transcript_3383/g.5128  ORF Transcript_3383/g.5128 Transcript_3383/m.5128 type:complete len:301 (+) Transcript_3383:175-1077(+)|eukprot:CAMPEP_0184657070 /NCGR_PEP_ID=MMETSP0308-20130426/16953_1 /TAXON_ID=38269 /ORGANISM="Gloeochaete witrockiana, Strain SAG 46.84" /LENGTH=300 /DNA_ID=CAMNT_0027094469 /DNA_START=150 /DNA_END=1052 /DNA_ORIENTATION=-